MNYLKSLLTAILPALFITGVVGAATTLSQNIVTDGDLTVGGSVGIGTVAPTEILHLQNSDTDIIQEENVDSSSSPSHFLYKSRGSALSKSIVQNGDELGFVTWRGFDGSNYVSGGAIGTYVDGTPGTDDMPGRLIFMTTPDGSSTVIERMRIDSSGRVGIGTDSPSSRLDVAGDVNSTGSYLGDGSRLTGIPVLVRRNLISYWKLENSLLDTGLTQDLSLQVGTETYVDSPLGSVLDFDGSTHYTANDTDYDFDTNDAFSVSAWVNTDDTSTSMIIAKGNNGGGAGTVGWYLTKNAAETVSFRITDDTPNESSADSSTALAPNSWNHVVGTYDGSGNENGLNIYINGVLDATGASSTISGSLLNDFTATIGAESDGDLKFTGQLSHIRVYNSELTAKHVETLFYTR